MVKSKKPQSDKVRGEENDLPRAQNEEAAERVTAPANAIPGLGRKLRALWHTRRGKMLYIGCGLVVLIALLLAIPTTRYGLLGPVLKKEVTIAVADKTTGKPVSKAEVFLAGRTVLTDGDGRARLGAISVGEYIATIKKQYYSDANTALVIPVLDVPATPQVQLEATGRQVLLSAVNKISGAPLSNATITVLDTSATTDENGEATIVLPTGTPTQKATLKADGYYETAVEVIVTEQKDKNNFSMTPIGEIYFLSKRTGKINVVKSRLDGSDQQVVLEGTGQEDDYDTVLLASRDWKHLALHAKRDSDKAKLYHLNTVTGKMVVMDEGDAYFQLIGWHNEHFIYKVTRNAVKFWEPKRDAVKSYNTAIGKLTILDENNAEGTDVGNHLREALGNFYILNGELVYTKDWEASFYSQHMYGQKRLGVYSVKPDGTNRRLVKDFDEGIGDAVGQGKLYKPNEVYFTITQDFKNTYWEYEDSKLHEAKEVTDQSFAKFYPTFLLSPSGQKTFWHEPRDGKNSLFVGKGDGSEEKALAHLTSYATHGWYGEDYLLLSKDRSELYIMPVDGDVPKALKVTDYHKAEISYPGYGYGYGGL